MTLPIDVYTCECGFSEDFGFYAFPYIRDVDIQKG